jgi:hypothetical protein
MVPILNQVNRSYILSYLFRQYFKITLLASPGSSKDLLSSVPPPPQKKKTCIHASSYIPCVAHAEPITHNLFEYQKKLDIIKNY